MHLQVQRNTSLSGLANCTTAPFIKHNMVLSELGLIIQTQSDISQEILYVTAPGEYQTCVLYKATILLLLLLLFTRPIRRKCVNLNIKAFKSFNEVFVEIGLGNLLLLLICESAEMCTNRHAKSVYLPKGQLYNIRRTLGGLKLKAVDTIGNYSK